MPTVARTIGGPGAGKTYRALEILEMCLERLVGDPLRVGFVSFTRAARREAAERAASQFGIAAADLEKEGWFRTLHSVCYRCLRVGRGELLTGKKDDLEWLSNALGESVEGDADEGDYLPLRRTLTEPERALALWDVARNRLEPLSATHEWAEATDTRLPPLEQCLRVVTAYERAKRRDGRLDFADLLLRFGGLRWDGTGFEEVAPEGDCPALPVWVHDEMQDCSALTGRVFRRLIAPSSWVYLMGDFLQSIYSWCGADGGIFAGWPVAREEELPVSHRCGQAVLDHAWGLLRDDPRAASRRAFRGSGESEVRHLPDEQALGEVRPGQDALVLARTNDYLKAAAKFLDDKGVPWRRAKAGWGANAPTVAEGIMCLEGLRLGREVDGDAYYRALALLPSKVEGKELFARGTKAWFDDRQKRGRVAPFTLANLEDMGGTALCRELIASGKYEGLLDAAAARLARQAKAHGAAAVLNPTVRLGTIHSAKGQQADEVVLLGRLPYPSRLALEADGAEERRVWYVGATRAKRRLTVGLPGDSEECLEGL